MQAARPCLDLEPDEPVLDSNLHVHVAGVLGKAMTLCITYALNIILQCKVTYISNRYNIIFIILYYIANGLDNRLYFDLW